MNLKKNLLVLVVALFTLGFVACSNDDDVISLPLPVLGTWSLSETSSDVKAGDETKEAIEKELGKSTFSMKYLILNEDGSYESTLNTVDKGVYKLENDSLHLIKAEVYSTETATTPSTQSFGVVFNTLNKMELTEDVTARFTEKYGDVEKVTVTFSLDRSVE